MKFIVVITKKEDLQLIIEKLNSSVPSYFEMVGEFKKDFLEFDYDWNKTYYLKANLNTKTFHIYSIFTNLDGIDTNEIEIYTVERFLKDFVYPEDFSYDEMEFMRKSIWDLKRKVMILEDKVEELDDLLERTVDRLNSI